MDELNMDATTFDAFMGTNFGFRNQPLRVDSPNLDYESIAPTPPLDMLDGMPGPESWMLQDPQLRAVQAQPAGFAPPKKSAKSTRPNPMTDDGRRECPNCHCSFKDLNRHMAQQACTGQNPTFCCPHPECMAAGTTFRWQKDLDRHKKSLHSGEIFYCKFAGCPKSYNRIDNCRRHETKCCMKPQV